MPSPKFITQASMTIKLSYENRGYLTVDFITDPKQIYKKLGLSGTDFSCSYNKNFIRLKKNKNSMLPPDLSGIAHFLSIMVDFGIITELDKNRYVNEYKEQSSKLIHIGKNIQNYHIIQINNQEFYDTPVSLPLSLNLPEEIQHLTELKLKYKDDASISIAAQQWITHFTKLQLVIVLENAQLTTKNERIKKEEITQKLLDARYDKFELKPGRQSLIDWLLTGMHQSNINPKILENIKKNLDDLLNKYPKFHPIFAAAAFWVVVGNDMPLDRSCIPLKKIHLKIFLNNDIFIKERFFGFYDGYHALFLRLIPHIKTLLHELLHGVINLSIENQSLPFQINSAQAEIWKQLAKNVVDEILDHGMDEEILSYLHYAEEDWAAELPLRFLEYLLDSPASQTSLSSEILEKINHAFGQLIGTIIKWNQEFFNENGLILLPEFDNFDLLSRTEFSLSRKSCNILKQAHQDRVSVLDYVLETRLMNYSIENAVTDLLTQYVEPEALLFSAARKGWPLLEALFIQTDISKLSPTNLYKALCLAANHGHLEIVQILINQGISANLQPDRQGLTPLHYASAQGHLPIISLLIEKGFNVTAQDVHGDTPAHWAAKHGHTDILRLLIIASGANAHINDKGFTPLHQAVLHEQLDAMSTLLELGLDCEARSKDGSTALHLAVASRNTACVNKLLPICDVNVTTDSGDTPLHIAVGARYQEGIELLLKHGAKPDAVNKTGTTPLYLAIESMQEEIASRLFATHPVNLLHKNCRDRHVLHLLAKTGNIDLTNRIIHTLINSVNDMDDTGSTPLWLAIQFNQPQMVRFLAAIPEVDVNKKNKEGDTPLLFALKNPDLIKCAEALLQQSAVAIDETDDRGNAAIHYAALYGGYADIINSLAKHAHFNPNSSNEDGKSPLYLAVKKRHLPAVISLFKAAETTGKKIDIEYKNGESGMTALHAAVIKGDTALVKLLLKNGANCNAKTNEGYTALHYAAEYNRLEIMHTLIMQEHLDINPAASKDATPLHFAVMGGHIDIVSLLCQQKMIKLDLKTSNGMTALDLADRKNATALVRIITDAQSRTGNTESVRFWQSPPHASMETAPTMRTDNTEEDIRESSSLDEAKYG